MQAPYQTPAPVAPPPRSYFGIRLAIVVILCLVLGAAFSQSMPPTLIRARTLAYPTPRISLSASAVKVGTGQNVSFTVNVISGHGLTYMWDFGDGNPVAGLATVTHTWSQYCQQCEVFVIATDGIGQTARASTTEVVLPPMPTASFTFQPSVYYNFTGCYDFDASASTGDGISYS